MVVDRDCIIPLGIPHMHVALTVSLLMVGGAPNCADEASTSGAGKTFVCVTFSDE